MVNAWVRVDANLAANHKVLALMEERGGEHAICVYVFALGHSMTQNSDGFVSKAALGLFHGKAKDAQLLVSVGMWHELPGGWQIHDWAEYQPSSEEAQKRADKAKRAAAARWGNVQQTTDEQVLGAMPGALPDDVPSIAPPMPRTYVRNKRTNAVQDSGSNRQVPNRARGNDR